MDAFLEAHDSGLTEAERELAKGMEMLRLTVVNDDSLSALHLDLINAEPVK